MMPLRCLFLVSFVLVAACAEQAPAPEAKKVAVPAPAKPAAPVISEVALVFFEALPERMDTESNPYSEAKVNLGRMLFYEKRLSKNHDVSCNSCHGLDTYGVDQAAVSVGHKGQRGGRSAPTVYNAGHYLVQFWDGRAADLEEQAKGPILNPIEMAMPSEKAVVKVLRSIPGYVKAFKEAFPKAKRPVTYDNMAKAIASFERGLVTPSRFDKFLKGDKGALNDAEKAGLQKFINLGCVTCHHGAAIGGTSYQRIGQVIPYDDVADQGRFEVTKNAGDKNVFKVPSLRNIEKTAPYFHNGRFHTLGQVVQVMAKHQLGKTLQGEEVASVIAFLKTLTGDLPMDYIKEPTLPKSGKKTPKPDPT